MMKPTIVIIFAVFSLVLCIASLVSAEKLKRSSQDFLVSAKKLQQSVRLGDLLTSEKNSRISEKRQQNPPPENFVVPIKEPIIPPENVLVPIKKLKNPSEDVLVPIKKLRNPSENIMVSIKKLRNQPENILIPTKKLISPPENILVRVRRVTGARTQCLPYVKKFCRKFTVSAVTKPYCISKTFFSCTALD